MTTATKLGEPGSGKARCAGSFLQMELCQIEGVGAEVRGDPGWKQCLQVHLSYIGRGGGHGPSVPPVVSVGHTSRIRAPLR